MERVLDEISFRRRSCSRAAGEASQEGVIAEWAVGATDRRPQKPSPPLPVIERKKDDGTVEKVIVVDPEYVKQQVASIVKDQDLSRYIL